MTRVPLQESEQKLTLNWRYGPGNRDIGDASYVTVPFSYQCLGLRPLSPVHIKGVRSSGDINISWIRRTRGGGDNWELPEVPLGEESESYEVDILDGSTVKRTLSASSPSVTYTSGSDRRLRQRPVECLDQGLPDQCSLRPRRSRAALSSTVMAEGRARGFAGKGPVA